MVGERLMVTRTKNQSCTGKKRFDTRAAANDEKFRLRRAGGSWPEVYKCKFCDGWHLGHKARRRR